MEGFRDLGLSPWLVSSVKALRITSPTPVQKGCVPAILEGRDVVACAETGSGKTAAFALPLVHVLGQETYGVFAVVLAPTRELSHQIAQQILAFGKPLGARVTLLIGGCNPTPQALELARLPHFVVGSPGRVALHLREGTLRLNKVRFLVLDEADRLLEAGGFQDDVAYIASQCSPKRQTLFFSATISPDLDTLRPLCCGKEAPFEYSQRAISTVEQLEEEFLLCPENVKICYLVYLVRSYEDASIILFASTVEECALLNQTLLLLDVASVALHSLMRQRERTAALEQFRGSHCRVLVATDVASRGLDIPQTDLVINYSPPASSDTYIHRVGRTARQGRSGLALTLVSQYELKLLVGVEDAIGKKLAPHEHEEDEVLEFLSESTTALKLAEVWMKEEGVEKKAEARKKRRKKEREEAAAASHK